MKSRTEKAYAKINLFLDVVAKREDGFHDIKTVMHEIALCDELDVAVEPSNASSVTLDVIGAEDIPVGKDNLVCKAAELYMQQSSQLFNVTVRLKKYIPAAAGLAGGSSDAAATIRALNALSPTPISDAEALRICAMIGSDVPFCYIGGTALCEGRGERISPIKEAGQYIFVVAKGSEAVSTPKAYAALDRKYSDFDGSIPTGGAEEYTSFMRMLCDEPRVTDNLFNIFESVTVPEIKSVGLIKSIMLECGASCALMSGSGPSVYGIFENTEAAEMAADALRCRGYFAIATSSATK